MDGRPRFRRTWSSAPRAEFVLVTRPSVYTIECMFAAAALMALADGEAMPVERTGFVGFLRRADLLRLLGRRASNARFAAALDNIAADPNAVPALIDRLRHLGSAGNALLVAKAAAWVAYADGVLDPRERAFFRAMRPALGIWPATSVGDGAPAGI